MPIRQGIILGGFYQEPLAALSETYGLAGADDVPAIGALHLRFKELRESLKPGAPAEADGLCTHAQAALERILLEETKDPGGDWALVGVCIACLRGLLCENRQAHELPMPTGLTGSGAGGKPRHEREAEADIPDIDSSLLADFVRESLDHLENADILLMSLESSPGDGEAINGVFRAFHTIKGVAGFLGFKTIQAFAHGTENLLDLVRLGKLVLDARILDLVFASVEVLRRRVQWAAAHGGAAAQPVLADEMRAVLEGVEAAARGETDVAGPLPPMLPPAEPGMRLGEILVAAGSAAPETVAAALRTQAEQGGGMRLGETLVKNAGVPAREVGLALASQKKAQEPAAAAGIKETVKVEADRLDRLLDAIGELVIAETMIFQSPEIKGLRSPLIAKQLVSLDKITRELQKMGTSLRMVPIRPVFQKMAKLARDLARKAGKNVEFQCSGDETELDKTVVDKIGDPLVHMVRNSLDHGIESDPEVRASAGKPPQARVAIRAFQKGGNVCIRIEDDGKGLDREAILRKARERGMPGSDAPDLSDRDIWNFIFEPGFSTAAQVTEISGRGVGMDVVRRNIGELRGRIEIESEAGKGTAFNIWLPLTLAIIDGMIVRVGGQRLVFPTLSILRIIPVRPEDTRAFLERGEMLLLQGEAIPLFDLAAYVPGCAPEPDGMALAVIVECGSRKAGLLVAELLGQQQVVIKGLGEALKLIPGVSGGAILSDGTVGMILDVDGLLANLKAAPAAVP
jgi:two-component system, chemotaxis family, sensor kinase CheA